MPGTGGPELAPSPVRKLKWGGRRGQVPTESIKKWLINMKEKAEGPINGSGTAVVAKEDDEVGNVKMLNEDVKDGIGAVSNDDKKVVGKMKMDDKEVKKRKRCEEVMDESMMITPSRKKGKRTTPRKKVIRKVSSEKSRQLCINNFFTATTKGQEDNDSG